MQYPTFTVNMNNKTETINIQRKSN